MDWGVDATWLRVSDRADDPATRPEFNTMPERLLQCRLCEYVVLQTTPEIPTECEHCHGAAHWRVYEAIPRSGEWTLSESDQRLLHSLRIEVT